MFSEAYGFLEWEKRYGRFRQQELRETRNGDELNQIDRFLRPIWPK